MTQTATLPQHPATGESKPFSLSDLIIALLTPMFVTASGGNLHYARIAAIETLGQFRARDCIDLIAIAQIIACSLAALGSLTESLADGLAASAALRLRSNAVSLNRIVGQNRRILREPRPAPAPEMVVDPTPVPDREPTGTQIPATDQAQYDAAVFATAAAAKKTAAEVMIRLKDTQPSPAAISGLSAGRHITDAEWQAKWASVVANETRQFTTTLPGLPPAERQTATHRANMLSGVANRLIAAGSEPTALKPDPARRA
jgi:hypothetical protein